MLKHLLIIVAVVTATHTAHASTHAKPREVVIYTTSQISLSHVPAGARVVLLDHPRLIEQEMSKGLPANPQQAVLAVQQRMKSPEWLKLQEELRSAVEGVVHAQKAGVRSVPAVTVDHSFVVYGMVNVAEALQQIERARARP